MNRKEYIGKQIAEARKKNGLTQKKVSDATGIDKTSISKIERGKLNATIDTIEKLCQAVGISIRTSGRKIFEDLVFEKHPFHDLADQLGDSYPDYKKCKTCYQATTTFTNGLHISVVIGELFRSNGKDTYEVCLWNESGYEEVFGHLTDTEVCVLMEQAQIVKDTDMMNVLQKHGFYPVSHFLSYMSRMGDHYVLVNPCGDAYLSYNHAPWNFSNMFFCNTTRLKEILDDIDGFVRMQEERQ